MNAISLPKGNAFGVDDVESEYPIVDYTELQVKMLFFVWVTLTEQKWVIFGERRGSGCFRWNDDFQILPVPQDAPQAKFLLADHPFLLQFRFAGSSNGMVEQARRHRRGLELELLLSGLVANHIRSDRTTVHRWVIPPPAGDPPRLQPSILCQMGYHYEGSRAVQDSFATCDGVSALKIVLPD